MRLQNFLEFVERSVRLKMPFLACSADVCGETCLRVELQFGSMRWPNRLLVFRLIFDCGRSSMRLLDWEGHGEPRR